MDDVMKVDELLVDSTYGSAIRKRGFRQNQVDDYLLDSACTRIRSGVPVVVIGHVGRIHTALHLLREIINTPVICSPKVFSAVSVYEKYGYTVPPLLSSDEDQAVELLRQRVPIVGFVSFSEVRHIPWVQRCCKISLSAHMPNISSPVVEYANGDCCIAYTDHADFDDTLDYVAATGATQVWTDSRTGDAEALATSIQNELGVACAVVAKESSFGWG